MTSNGSTPGGEASTASDYYGHATRRLRSDHLWVDVLATGGPRIVRVGLSGCKTNLLAETPGIGWETPWGRYELLGGHRLWFAPEDPRRVAVPDGSGLVLTEEPDAIRLTGQAEGPTGLVRSMVLRLAAAQASLEVRHELRNVGELPLQLAPWSITQLPLDGTVLLPQPRAVPGHHVHPNRTLVFWPYTSWEDPRFRPLDGLLTIEAQTGPNLKLGTFNEAGWIGYLRDGVGLVRRFEPAAGRPHPDLGCNVEVYVGGEFLELELLGPTTDLDPGATVVLVEHWEIRAVEVDDTADLRSLAERIGQRDPAAGIASSWLAG